MGAAAGERHPSCHSAEPAFGYESKELERGALRVLFPSFPLADEARRHIQITGEDSLTGPLPQTERADFPGRTMAARPLILSRLRTCWRKLSCLLPVVAQKSSRRISWRSFTSSPS